MACCVSSEGSRSLTMFLPGLPKMSPMNKIRKNAPVR